MKKLLGIVVLGLLIASPAFAFNEFMTKQQKRFKNSELVKIPSYRAFDFYSIQEGWYKESPSEFDALIIYPKGEGPFPLDGEDEKSVKKSIAMNIANVNHNRVRKLVFKIMENNIEKWWD